MSGDGSNLFVDWYTERIGTPSTTDEAYGYWVFVVGMVFGVVGILGIIAGDTPGATVRGIGIALAAIGLILMLVGPIIRLPLRAIATQISYIGALLGVVAIAWFSIEFNAGNWGAAFEHSEVYIIGLYGVGILTMAVGSVVTPLVTQSREQVEDARSEHEVLERVATLEEAEKRIEEAELRAQEAQRRAEEAEQRAQDAIENQTRRKVIETELQQIDNSQSQFELYTDAAGEHRWRLRHRNRNIIADSAEGYASRQKARQGLGAVKRDAVGATVVDLDALADLAGETATDAASTAADEGGATAGEEAVVFLTDLDSEARFETYRDQEDAYRWSLVHENGNTIADSGQGYSSAGARDDAIEYVRKYVTVADYLRIDPAAFEVGRDRDGSYYWRLLHRNGRVLARSGRRYDSRQGAVGGIERLRGTGRDDDGTDLQVYQDSPNEWRWRLVDTEGRVLAQSGDWYVSKENAGEAFDRVLGFAGEATLLDIGSAAVEIYEDRGEQWRWRLRHRNGRIMADSGEGYESRSGAEAGITSVKRNAPNAPVQPREREER